jgi:hypothetical protein
MHQTNGSSIVRANGVALSRTVPSEYVASLDAFQLRFAEASVPLGAAPILPDGALGLTDQSAATIAMGKSGVAPNGQLLPGIEVAARFGIFSNDFFAKGGPGIPMKLQYQDRPAWIVTFYGPGLMLTSDGPVDVGVKHAENIVIDAHTGEYLQTYS